MSSCLFKEYYSESEGSSATEVRTRLQRCRGTVRLPLHNRDFLKQIRKNIAFYIIIMSRHQR